MLLPAADIFFLSSRQEGMPNVLLEAIDAGLVPFATDVGGVSDIFRNVPKELLGKILIKSRNPAVASKMLSELILDKELQEVVAKFAQKFLKEVTPDKIIKQYCNFLME